MPIGSYDLLIAANAAGTGAAMVTAKCRRVQSRSTVIEFAPLAVAFC
jgi:hypothetical protein